MPFCGWLAWRKADYLAATAAAAIFVVASGSSYYAGVGLAAEHRSTNAGHKQQVVDQRHALTDEQATLKQRLTILGPLGTPAELTQTIEAAFAKPIAPGEKTLAIFSNRCRTSMVRTREACAHVAQLQVTLAQSEEAAAARLRLVAIQMELDHLDAGVQSADPQVDVLYRLATWTRLPAGPEDLRLALLLTIGLLLELGSGLGLYAVTTPWRHAEPQGRFQMSKLGDPAAYADQRLSAVRGSKLTANQLYADYADWCRQHNYVPMREGVFAEQLIVLAGEIGMATEQAGSNLVFCDVSLQHDQHS
jgi:hypothetical protein